MKIVSIAKMYSFESDFSSSTYVKIGHYMCVLEYLASAVLPRAAGWLLIKMFAFTLRLPY